MGEVALLGLENKVDMAVTVQLVLSGDLKDGLAQGKVIQSQQLAELVGTGLTVGFDGRYAVPAEGGMQGG
jgi:hypothetical protein